MSVGSQPLIDGDVSLRRLEGDDGFVVEREGSAVGQITVRVTDPVHGVGQVSWDDDLARATQSVATRAMGLVARHAFSALGLHRLEAVVPIDDRSALIAAWRTGMRKEGVLRGRRVVGGSRTDLVQLARLADDPGVETPVGFNALLNSSLPIKRVIAQMLLRDEGRRILMCELTYKHDWDLPGGVVEPSESPRRGAVREVYEELGLSVEPRGLLAVDWLPPWNGWDDACAFVFDGGTLSAQMIESVVLQPRELKSIAFVALDEVVDRCTSATARRIRAVAEGVPGRVLYLEGGRVP
jgi:8-oxo-dGTP pyrophosphatase MutT (NUDIX family)